MLFSLTPSNSPSILSMPLGPYVPVLMLQGTSELPERMEGLCRCWEAGKDEDEDELVKGSKDERGLSVVERPSELK